jgi:hypothetical protein
MLQRTATIESLPVVFEVMEGMQAQGLDWGERYRPLGSQALMLDGVVSSRKTTAASVS